MCFKDFFKTAKLFITNPSQAFKKEEKTDIDKALKYGIFGYLIVALLSATMQTALIAFFSKSAINLLYLFISMLFFCFTFGVIILWFMGLWLHLWMFIFGAKEGIKQTVKAVFYGSTPDYLFGWIPFFSIVAGFWSLALIGIGLTKHHKLPGWKTALAIIIAIISLIVLIVALIFALAFVLSTMSQSGLPLYSL